MKKIFYILIVGILFTSCKDSFMDVEPTNKIDEKLAFKSEKSLNATVVGLYDFLQSHLTFGRVMVMNSEVRGDDMLIDQNTNWGYSSNDYNYAYSQSNSDGNSIYLNMYRIIEGANNIINYNDNGLIKLDDAVKEPYIAETKAIRALCYFHLVRLFCTPYIKDKGASAGVPIKLVTNPEIHQPRGTVAQVYAQILKDLNFANGKIRDNRQDRMTNVFVKGLLARVYMAQGENKLAIKLAQEALAGAPALSKNDYATGVSQENTSMIWQLQYTEDTYFHFKTLESFFDFGFDDGTGYGTLGVAEDLYKNYSANDLRKSWYINTWTYENKIPLKTPMTNVAFLNIMTSSKATYEKYAGGLIVKGLWDDAINGISPENLDKLARFPWTGDSGFKSQMSLYGKYPRLGAEKFDNPDKFGKEGTKLLGYVPMMRTPELVLIIAECAAMDKNYPLARTSLESIQKNANADVFAGADKDLLKAIRLERRKELVGEGFRIYDILRQQEVVTRNNYWGDSRYKVIDPTKADSKAILPIPQNEIDSNSKMTEADQNPAYI